MSFNEEDLRDLNEKVYYVDKNKAKKEGERPIKTGRVITIGKKKKKVFVVKTKFNKVNGYKGIAVAPYKKNGKPDLKNIAVISSGTDPSQTSDVSSALRDGKSINRKNDGGDIKIEGQIESADKFVKSVMTGKNRITKLSGYSQGAYMIKIGAKHGIPTTVFNGWFNYNDLSDSEKLFVKNNPRLFVNYRNNKDNVTVFNDWNLFTGEDYGTIVWGDSSSHSLNDWIFDRDGKLVIKGNIEDKVSASLKQFENNTATSLWYLKNLAKDLKASGGALTKAEAVYLDSSEALIILENCSQSLRTSLTAVVAVCKDAITKSEQLWKTTLKLARSIGSELNEAEIIDALKSGGTTRAKIVDKPCEQFNERMKKVIAIGDDCDELINEIKNSINTLVQTDEDLSQQFKL